MQAPEQPEIDTPVTADARLHLESFPDGVHILVLPNRSLTRAGLFMAAGLCVTMLVPALLYAALIGAWPMLPFLGLEILVVGGAFLQLHWHHDDCEEIVIGDEQVVVRRQHGRQRESLSFPRYWVQLVMEPGDLPRRSPRLWLRSHGHREELSRDASAATRQALAWTLTHELGIPTASH
jgi:uncharacterized membrane protein